MPTHSAGLKSVLSYYTKTAKLSSEGDVHMSDEALSGMGTTLAFLKTSLFGAVTQLVRPSPAQAPPTHPPEEDLDLPVTTTTITKPDFNPKTKTFEQHQVEDVPVADDPHMPVKPARRKEQDAHAEPLKLTDFVPDVGYFIAGGVSGITSRTATAPLDRLKVYLITQTGQSKAAVEAAKSGAALQATKHSVNSLTNACKELWAAGGVRSLFAGQ